MSRFLFLLILMISFGYEVGGLMAAPSLDLSWVQPNNNDTRYLLAKDFEQYTPTQLSGSILPTFKSLRDTAWGQKGLLGREGHKWAQLWSLELYQSQAQIKSLKLFVFYNQFFWGKKRASWPVVDVATVVVADRKLWVLDKNFPTPLTVIDWIIQNAQRQGAMVANPVCDRALDYFQTQEEMSKSENVFEVEDIIPHCWARIVPMYYYLDDGLAVADKLKRPRNYFHPDEVKWTYDTLGKY